MSRSRPTMVMSPDSDNWTTSPLRYHPSVKTCPVASGSRQYPDITFEPLIHSSPGSPSVTSWPCLSTARIWTPVVGKPDEPRCACPSAACSFCEST